MKLGVMPSENGFFRLITESMASLYFKRDDKSYAYHISTEVSVTNEDGTGWHFTKDDLREAAELFMQLADELEVNEKKGEAS